MGMHILVLHIPSPALFHAEPPEDGEEATGRGDEHARGAVAALPSIFLGVMSPMSFFSFSVNSRLKYVVF